MRFLLYRLPALALMGLIFLLSSRPLDWRIAGMVPDWAAHASVYLLLYLLVYRAVHEGMLPRPGRGGTLSPLLITILYGLTDEYHQSFVPCRDASASDLFADAAGAAIGLLLVRAWIRSRPAAAGSR